MVAARQSRFVGQDERTRPIARERDQERQYASSDSGSHLTLEAKLQRNPIRVCGGAANNQELLWQLQRSLGIMPTGYRFRASKYATTFGRTYRYHHAIPAIATLQRKSSTRPPTVQSALVSTRSG